MHFPLNLLSSSPVSRKPDSFMFFSVINNKKFSLYWSLDTRITHVNPTLCLVSGRFRWDGGGGGWLTGPEVPVQQGLFIIFCLQDTFRPSPAGTVPLARPKPFRHHYFGGVCTSKTVHSCHLPSTIHIWTEEPLIWTPSESPGWGGVSRY